jgi:amino acid efflux transporter
MSVQEATPAAPVLSAPRPACGSRSVAGSVRGASVLRASVLGTLSVPRGAALYIGALLGPGLLLLPGLAAAQAGPASILAWLGLIGLSGLLAMVFAALGRTIGSGGVIAYTTASLGPRAGAAAGWCFLVGVVCGAPIVCLIGATYVTDLAGGGQLMRALVASALLLAVLGLALGGVRATTAAQLVLVGLLIAVVVVAVAGSAPAARAASWTPFAPHGWPSIGRAASTLMLSFVGWEAVAPLTARLRNPARQLPRVIGIAFGTTTLLYLGLAVATIACLGRGAATNVPLAALLELAMGPAGRAVAAVAALILTLGATNAYLSGATEMIGQLTAARRVTAGRVAAGRVAAGRVTAGRVAAGRQTPARRTAGRVAAGRVAAGRQAPARRTAGQVAAGRAAAGRRTAAGRSAAVSQGVARPATLLLIIAATGLVLIGLYALHLVTTTALVTLPTTMFLGVYLASTAAATRVLTGPARLAAWPALLAVATVLAFCGWALAAAAAVAAIAAVATTRTADAAGTARRLAGRTTRPALRPVRRTAAAGRPALRPVRRTPAAGRPALRPVRRLTRTTRTTRLANAVCRSSCTARPDPRTAPCPAPRNLHADDLGVRRS